MEERRDSTKATGDELEPSPSPLPSEGARPPGVLCPRVSANSHEARHLGPQTLSKPQAAAFLETSSLLSGEKHV